MKITLSDCKTILDLDKNQLNPIIGYQIFHRHTGRILPQCNYHEVYDRFLIINKMLKLYRLGLIENPNEWELVPIYECEWTKDNILIKK